jgi:hypothetical protein
VFRPKPEEGVKETHESLWSWRLFRDDVLSFLRSLLSRFLRRRRAREAEVGHVAALAEDDTVFADVRELYKRVLWQGSFAGHAHRPGETPYEYEARLGGHFPEGRGHLGQITGEYVAHRYGQVKVSPERLNLLNRLWRTLRQVLLSEAKPGSAK